MRVPCLEQDCNNLLRTIQKRSSVLRSLDIFSTQIEMFLFWSKLEFLEIKSLGEMIRIK